MTKIEEEQPMQDTSEAGRGADMSAKLQAGFAGLAGRIGTVTSRIPDKYKTQTARRRLAAGLLLIGGGMIAWQTFMPAGKTDVANALTRVRDVTTEIVPAQVQAPVVSAVAPASSDTDILPRPPSAGQQPAALPTPPIRKLTGLREMQASTGDGPCAITIEAMPLAAALVAIDVSAPCDVGKRVDVIQGDLQVALMLDDEGKAQVDMPALTAMPAVAVLVSDRDPLTVQAEIVDHGMYHRAVLHWQGNAALELHAFEGDAGYGDDGHVAPDTPRTIAHALSNNGGFLSTLGDPEIEDARVALVYTIPEGLGAEMSIEAPVTEANCGTEVYAGTIQTAPGAAPVAQDLTFTLPECEAVGDFVILGDLMRPIAVASN